MKTEIKKPWARRDRTAGFSLIELLIVVFVVMVVAAIAVPNVLLAVANLRLRSSAGDLAGLMQQARIMAAKNNPTTPIAVYPIVAGNTGTSFFDNTQNMAFTPRGFPCNYTTPPTCATPATTYFAYYLTDTRAGGAGWAAVIVTKAGRTKVVTWNGAAWN